MSPEPAPLTPLPEVAEHIRPALDFLFDVLGSAATECSEHHAASGLAQDDRSYIAIFIRKRVAAAGAESGLGKTGNMSPVHWTLGPYTVRLLLARAGIHPTPQTNRRRDDYELNDAGVVLLNVFPPDAVTAIPPDVGSLEALNLTVLWDYRAGVVTQFTLCRPSLSEWPGEHLDLLPIAAGVDDLDITRKVEGGEGEEADSGSG